MSEKWSSVFCDRQIINETLCIDYTPAQHHELAEATKVIIDAAAQIKDALLFAIRDAFSFTINVFSKTFIC